MVASLIFEVVLGLPPEKRIKPIAVLCTDTRVEIPAIVEMVETTLAKMRKCSIANNLNIEVHLLRPPAEQSFWSMSSGVVIRRRIASFAGVRRA